MEGKTKTPAGKAEGVRPHRSVSDEEAHQPPAESEVLHGNQQRCHKRFSFIYPICSFSDWINVVMSHLFFYILPLANRTKAVKKNPICTKLVTYSFFSCLYFHSSILFSKIFTTKNRKDTI
ncbi:hypothetical protein BMD_1040 [Priestia megaterium DSM 319]|uniref:Uncharacterized protein n=1 Tax=Priestia megaterium (strain DSM 319 / IMG 1521) TaxID=592022 RepID=D5DBB9_PRIM3|nr:hypothetical protein BMD_1040 [Priestia megaterium DSM 319]